jgi:hypothetical protein
MQLKLEYGVHGLDITIPGRHVTEIKINLEI